MEHTETPHPFPGRNHHRTPAQTPLDDPEELARFLAAYEPTNVPAHVWRAVSAPAASLVLGAGQPTRLRVEKDMQLLGAVCAHLLERGRPVTLEEALSDSTLLSFDTALQASEKTKENKRGIHRRLQATHRGLPWRADRRADGDRVQKMTSHTALACLRHVHDAAQAAPAGDLAARAFVDVLAAARRQRAAGAAPEAGLDAATWTRARRFAQPLGLDLTKPVLRALVTQEVIDVAAPVAVLVAKFGLTRRDLDLALTRVADLPPTTDPEVHAVLRGA